MERGFVFGRRRLSPQGGDIWQDDPRLTPGPKGVDNQAGGKVLADLPL